MGIQRLTPLLLALSAFVFKTAGADLVNGPIKPRIVTTVLPVHCFTLNVVRDSARVENLLGKAGPHEFQFSVSDLRKVARADLLIANGLQLEPWLDKVAHARDSNPLTVVKVGNSLKSRLIPVRSSHVTKPNSGIATDRDPEMTCNPHFWLDPTLAEEAVGIILAALEKADPAHHADYRANAEIFQEQLSELDREFARELSSAKAAFVTFHDAFPYLARRYDLNLVGVIEPKPGIRPSFRDLAKLMRKMRDTDARVIFVEPESEARLAEQISRDLNVPIAELDPLETGDLTADAYLEGMRRNLNVLKRYLD